MSPLGGGLALAAELDFVQQQATGQDPVASLMAGLLAFHLNARGPMNEHDARGSLIDVLPTMPSGPNKRFLNVLFADAEGRHALAKFVIALELG